MIYLDTSALIKLYLKEEGSELVQSIIESQSFPLPVGEFQEAELTNALWLNVFWKKITSAQAKAQIDLFYLRKKKGLYFVPDIQRGDFMSIFRDLSQQTSQIGCRTMDIFHVACAVHIGSKKFITFDERQKKLAHFVKLKTN